MRVWAALLSVAVALAACSAASTKITAAPGMTADDFNRANAAAGIRLRTDQTDWIGVNAPVDLTINWNGKTVTFEDRQRGGGMQRVADVLPRLEQHCRVLAQMAGVLPARLPSPEQVSQSFRQTLAKPRLADSALDDAIICTGSGQQIGFTISASHYAGDASHGGDHAFAFIRGYVGRAALPEGKPAF